MKHTESLSTPAEIEVLKDSQTRLLTQWQRSTHLAAQPENDPLLFRNIPHLHIDVPAAKMDALDAARSFARVSTRLAQEKAIGDKREVYQTLHHMAEFCAGQYEDASLYADLKWPHTLTGRNKNEEIDTGFHKRRRNAAQEAMLNISDALTALHNG